MFIEHFKVDICFQINNKHFDGKLSWNEKIKKCLTLLMDYSIKNAILDVGIVI